jgi:hypothetical protein
MDNKAQYQKEASCTPERVESDFRRLWPHLQSLLYQHSLFTRVWYGSDACNAAITLPKRSARLH